jgi:Tol biopolymer transport system component
VTGDGSPSNPYQYPTQADNGTIESERGYTTLLHFDRNGRLLGPRIKVATGTSNNISLHTLSFGPAISPNGRWIADSIMEYQGLYNPVTGGRSANIIAQNIEYYNAQTGKRTAETHAAGTYFMSPSWFDNTHALIFAPYNIAAAQVIVDERNRPGWAWFADGDALSFNRLDLDQGELTRNRSKLVLVRGTDLQNNWRGASIQIYSVSSLHAVPTKLCSLKAQHGQLLKPTWSPDGSTIAWSDSNGIWESPVTPGTANCGLSSRLIVRGGSRPDWGPVGVAR